MNTNNLVAQHIEQVIGFLNDKADYAVLRNFEELPENNKSRDIDIIITRRSYHSMIGEFVKFIDNSGWKIVTYLHSDRLLTLVCGRADNVHIELVQWDFFINTSVFGILLMDAEEFLKHKKFNGFLYYVDSDCQFLDKFLYNRAVGRNYPDKYRATREKAEHTQMVIDKVNTLYGCSSVAQCDNVSNRRLLMRAIMWNCKRNFVDFICNVFCFLYTYIKNYLYSNTGFSIGFTGPDGAGKTTVIDMMIDSFGDVFRKAYSYYHFRPTLIGNLGEVAHSAGVKKEVDRDFDKPHRGGKTGVFNSLLRLSYYSVDYICGFWLKVKTVTRITRIVIFDRYYTDIICDSRRSRIYLNTKFLYYFGKVFIPSLNYNILLTANIDNILSRKQELNRSGIEKINQKIDYLANKKGYYKVMNNSTPQEAVSQILNVIFNEQHEKNLKRL